MLFLRKLPSRPYCAFDTITLSGLSGVTGASVSPGSALSVFTVSSFTSSSTVFAETVWAAHQAQGRAQVQNRAVRCTRPIVQNPWEDGSAQECAIRCIRARGWGRRIRTPANGSRARRPTARRSPSVSSGPIILTPREECQRASLVGAPREGAPLIAAHACVDPALTGS